jgi:hypothetical protein
MKRQTPPDRMKIPKNFQGTPLGLSAGFLEMAYLAVFIS